MNQFTQPQKVTANAQAPAQERLPFLGMDYDNIRFEETLDRVFIRPADAPFATLVTPNADHIYRMNNQPALVSAAYRNAWLCVNDSKVVAVLSELRGVTLHTTPGSDLVVAMFKDGRLKPDTKMLMVGGTPELADKLRQKFGLTQFFHHDAPMGLMRNRAAFDSVVAAIEKVEAQFIFMAVGSPQQELIAEAVRERGKATGIGLCIGASMEFLVGTRKRAPKLVQKIGMEWAFRLLCEPRRLWRRYLINSPQIFTLYLRDLTTSDVHSTTASNLPKPAQEALPLQGATPPTARRNRRARERQA